jgi:hypothetical protein
MTSSGRWYRGWKQPARICLRGVTRDPASQRAREGQSWPPAMTSSCGRFGAVRERLNRQSHFPLRQRQGFVQLHGMLIGQCAGCKQFPLISLRLRLYARSKNDRIRPLDDPRLIPRLTPHGRLLLAPSDQEPEPEPTLAERLRGGSRSTAATEHIRYRSSAMRARLNREVRDRGRTPGADTS